MKQKKWSITILDNPNLAKALEKDEFYTTDTEAFLVFELKDKNFNPTRATITLHNRTDGSVVNEDVDVIDCTIEYEMRHEVIEHAGFWQAQLVYEQDKDGVPEKYTSKVVNFSVSGHLLDTKEPALVVIENWDNFVLSAESLIEDWEQSEALREAAEQERDSAEGKRASTFTYNENSRKEEFEANEADRQQEFEANETVRQSQEESRENAETARQEAYDDLIDTGVMQENINQKLAASEAEYAPRLTSLEQNDAELTTQLAQTMHIIGDRIVGESNDNGRLERLFQKSIGGTCKIPSGTYYIDGVGTSGANRGVAVPSNINIIMEQDTVLKAIPNDQSAHTVLTIYNVENVTITGGKIIGERYEHTGTSGEHGMGINILHSNNVSIDGVAVTECWGDSIYIGGNNWGVSGDYCENITIKNCIIDDSRRQGISVTLADGVDIKNCKITNINGTSPQYGIDVETNLAENVCRNINISNCFFEGSVGGGVVIGNYAKTININGSTFKGNGLNLTRSEDVKINNSFFDDTFVTMRSSQKVGFSNNILSNTRMTMTSHSEGELSNVLISSNVFDCKDNSFEESAITINGNSKNIYDVVVTSNSFKNFSKETIYMFEHVDGMLISNNLITVKNKNISRWVLGIRGKKIRVLGNNVIISNDEVSYFGYIVNFTGSEITIEGNGFELSGVMPTSVFRGESVQNSTISSNNVHSENEFTAVSLSSNSLLCKVLFNDFSFTKNAFSGLSGHMLYNNLIGGTTN